MGAGGSLDRSGLAALSVFEVADLVSESWLPEYRQASIDFGIDGDMLARLPRDQLADALCRAGVESNDDLQFLLGELETIRSLAIDSGKLDRENLREMLPQLDKPSSYGFDDVSETSDWSGVSVNTQDRITALNVANKDLSGELPAALGDVSCLEQLHATSNSFVGCIPETIGRLTSLRSLQLDHNKLSGRLPGSLTRLTRLSILDLAWNGLEGTIPTKIGTMTALRKLSLGKNKLNGAIPRELGSLHFLLELRLRENKLVGKIPPLLSNMRSLQVLDLTSNLLQGHIPESLGGMIDLRKLWLGGNQLVGGIPETLGKLRNLESLDLSCNKLGATIPRRLFSGLSSSLVYLNLSRNALEGETHIAALSPYSRKMALAESDISSSEYNSVGTASWATRAASSPLSYLNMSRNRLTGCIPKTVGALTSLDTLDLSRNKLEGPVPSDIGGCRGLRTLSLSCCGLSGQLDGSSGGNNGRGLGGLTLLESLRLDGNLFEGDVPVELGNLSRLEVLQLQNNCFSGCLPRTLGQLGRLWTLGVRDNALSGRVPESLGRLTCLRSLRLEGNPSLKGPVPESLTSRPDCAVTADDNVLEDTEATKLGARLGDWFLMTRKAFLNLREFPGFASARPSLVRYVSTVVPYECHVFATARERRLVVRQKEIAFFSHCWDLPPEQPPYGSAKARFVFDSVECILSMWNKGDREEECLSWGKLSAAGLLADPVDGKLSDPDDRRDVAEAAIGAIGAMELSGRMDPSIAKPMRYSCKKLLYGSQGWEGDRQDEEDLLSIRSDKISRGGTGLKRFRRVRAVDTPPSSVSVATSEQLTLSNLAATG
eukprot:jgi/Undpi1/13801/HiC_scaffold_9.g03452.m1